MGKPQLVAVQAGPTSEAGPDAASLSDRAAYGRLDVVLRQARRRSAGRSRARAADLASGLGASLRLRIARGFQRFFSRSRATFAETKSAGARGSARGWRPPEARVASRPHRGSDASR